MSVLAAAEARLRGAGWLTRPETQTIFALLDGAAGRTRAVGGIVRDTLLERHRDNADVDFATELLPGEVIERAEAAGIASYPTGIEHGTITLRIGEFVAEVTTLRRDVKTDGRHAQVAFGTDWTEDARRRDFTLNALYAGPSGALFDPLGGLGDCLAGRVRFIGDPAQRVAEDGLRVFRFFRFSASHGGEVFDAGGLAACADAVGKLGHLSAERVGAEMKRMLSLQQIAATLRVMTQIGLMPFDDTLLSSLKTYERQTSMPEFHGRLALILQQLDAPVVQRRWRLSNADIEAGLEIWSASDLLCGHKINEAIYQYGDRTNSAIGVAAVLAGWDEAEKIAMRDQVASIAPGKFPLGGQDLLDAGMLPGPAVGELLRRLEKTWVESGFTLDRQTLLDLTKA